MQMLRNIIKNTVKNKKEILTPEAESIYNPITSQFFRVWCGFLFVCFFMEIKILNFSGQFLHLCHINPDVWGKNSFDCECFTFLEKSDNEGV